MILPTKLNTTEPLIDTSGHELTIAYVGENDFGGPLAIYYGSDLDNEIALMHHFEESEIDYILRTGRFDKGKLKIQW